MQRILSALMLFALSTSTLHSQATVDSAPRTSMVVQVRRSYEVRHQSFVMTPGVESGRSHAMRNGAIVGAAAGLIAGVVGSTYLHFGCLSPVETGRASSSCSEARSERVAAASLGVAGTLSGAIVGAVVGKLVSLTLF